MSLSKEQIEEFKTIYKKEFGKEISDSEAYEQGTKLVRLLEILHKENCKHEFMKKHTIKNRKQLNIVIEVEETENQKGLVFIVHGLGGFKEQHQMEAMKRAFLSNG